MSDDAKTCPDCAESVKAAARVCRYCGWSFFRAERVMEARQREMERMEKEEPDLARTMKDLYARFPRKPPMDRLLLMAELMIYDKDFRSLKDRPAAGMPSAPSRGERSTTFGLAVFDDDLFGE